MKVEESVAEDLRRAHAALLDDVRKLKAAVAPASKETLAELRTRLAATGTHVAKHFQLEEENGYLAAVRKREPRLEHAIEHLAAEHRQLTQSLGALTKEASTLQTVDEGFRHKVQEWVQHLHQHELHENELVQDAVNVDIGTKD